MRQPVERKIRELYRNEAFINVLADLFRSLCLALSEYTSPRYTVSLCVNCALLK